MKLITSDHGASLIEVMVALGIITVASFGVMGITTLANKGQATAQSAYSLSVLHALVGNHLSVEAICNFNFAGTVFAPGTPIAVGNIRRTDNSVVVATNQQQGSYFLASMSLDNFVQVSTSATGDRYLAQLTITGTKESPAALERATFGANDQSRTLSLGIITPTGTTQIQRCSTGTALFESSQATIDACQALGGFWDASTAAGFCDFSLLSVPSGAVVPFNSAAACPGGWAEYTDARGRYIVGAIPGGTIGAASVVGTALTNLENRGAGQHTHAGAWTEPAHAHYSPNGSSWNFVAFMGGGGAPVIYKNGGSVQGYGSFGATTGPVVTANWTVTTSDAGTSTTAGTNAPYVQLKYCLKN